MIFHIYAKRISRIGLHSSKIVLKQSINQFICPEMQSRHWIQRLLTSTRNNKTYTVYTVPPPIT